jgi:hypothetical protein
MNDLLQALPWPLVCGAVLWVAHKHGEHFWAARLEAKRLSDQDRLTKVEGEVKALILAQNLKGLRNG